MRLSILIIASLILLASCGGNVGSFKHQKNDTTKTIGLYKWDKYIRSTIIFIIVKDTFKFANTDSETLKRKWVRDTLYFIPVSDTARDKFGVAQKDSSGNYKSFLQWPTYPSSLIYATLPINLDTIMKRDSVTFETPDKK